MHRREFLHAATGAALGLSLTPRRSAAAADAKPPSAATVTAACRAIEALVPRLLEDYAIPGAALAIVHDGRLAWHRGFGLRNAATREPVDSTTLFEAASVSKTVFAYAVLKLCERGTLGLDTPLTRYTKRRFFEGDARLDRVTARHALAHTTGFPEWRSGSPPLKFLAAPGERFLYSGEGYFYLQSVVSEIAGRTFPAPCGKFEADLEVCATDFDDFMRTELLGPLGLNASGYLWQDRFAARLAYPHDGQGRTLPAKQPNAADIARYGAAGELRTTATDYAKFLSAVLTLPPGEAFLGAALRDEMLRPQVKLPPTEKIDGADSWALGWAIHERPTGHVILHSGGQSGYRSLTMASLARKSGFVILTNSDNGGRLCYDRHLGDLLTPLLAG